MLCYFKIKFSLSTRQNSVALFGAIIIKGVENYLSKYPDSLSFNFRRFGVINLKQSFSFQGNFVCLFNVTL